ncbi:hypothetical protein AU476_09475 [Cupriavidus sp. UYMSc13B]|nr:hypothetical protein AU476_09475 [Cupriavidus sp. UYMSc13B]
MKATILENRTSELNELRNESPLQNDTGAATIDGSQQNKAAQATITAEAGLVELVAGPRTQGPMSGSQGIGRHPAAHSGGETMELSAPKVSADSLRVYTLVVEGIKHELDNQSHLMENPSMATAVRKLLQFTTQPKGIEAKGPSRQPEHATQLESIRPKDPNNSIGSLFGESAFEQAFLVMLDLTNALQESSRAEAVVAGKMVVMMRAAAETSANATRAQGQAMLTGAITGSILQTAMVVASTQQQYAGLKTKANSIENELKPQADLRRKQTFEFHGAGSTKLSEDNVAAQKRSALQHRIDMHGINHAKNEIVGDRLRLKGLAFDAGGAIAKSMVGGVTDMNVHNLRGQQTLAESDEKCTSSLSDAHRQNVRKMSDVMQRVLEIAISTANDNAAVASQVASGIKV